MAGKPRYSGPVEEHFTPYKWPRQKRSRESLERLLETTEEQIRLNGVEALTISGVVNSVGLSVGAFYARFPDKTALLHAVQDRFHNRLEPAIREQLTAEAGSCDTLAEAVEAAVEVLIRNVVGERELSRGFMSLSVADRCCAHEESWSTGRGAKPSPKCSSSIKKRSGIPDPELAINVAYGMYAAVVRGRLMFGAEHEALLRHRQPHSIQGSSSGPSRFT
jgi:AcrR family transcriptional regulator